MNKRYTRFTALLALVLSVLLVFCACGPTAPDVSEVESVGESVSESAGESTGGEDASEEDVTSTEDAASAPETSDDTVVTGDASTDDTDTVGTTAGTVAGGDKPTATQNSGQTTAKTTVAATTTKKPAATGDNYGETGDTSFKISVTGLQKNTVYMVSRSALGGNSRIMGHDILRLFASLQGLINRDMATNKIAVMVEPYATGDQFWLDYMKKSNAPLAGMKTVKITTMEDLLETFKNQIVSCGLVVWDTAVPATANVAATICGLDGFLPVKNDQDGLLDMLKGMGAKVKLNLTGRFTGKGIIPGTKIASTGSAKNDAYLWAMEKYMHRCSTKYMMYVADGASCIPGNPIYDNDNCAKDSFGAVCLTSHDYGIARRCFFFDLSPIDSETPSDDKDQKRGTDLATTKILLKKRYDMAGGEFGCMVGFPPWQLKYSKHTGGSVADTTLEHVFVQYITQYNMYLDANFSVTNTSVYYQYDIKSSYKNGDKTVTEKFDDKTIYVYYHLGDYDATGWALSHLWNAYQDPNRGKIPLTWAVNPGLADRIPMLFEYMYENKTAADTFCASDSGVGYVKAENLFPNDDLVDGRVLPSGADAFVKVNKKYFQWFDMDVVSFAISTFSKELYGVYNQFAPAGTFHYDRAKPLTIYKGVPYVPTKNGVGDPGSYAASAQGMMDYLNSTMKGTNFLATRTITWTPSQLMELTKAFEKIAADVKPGYKVKVVNAYNFLDLVKQSGQATVIN